MYNSRQQIKDGNDSILRSELTWKGAELFDFMRQYQPERFKEKKKDGTLIPFLAGVASDWESRMTEHLSNGFTFAKANELEHELLMEMAGFMN